MVANTVTNTVELSIKDAAAKLGISQAAVYMRIKRNPSLSPRKGYVLLPGDDPTNSVSNNVENVSESLTDDINALLRRIAQLEEEKSRIAERVQYYKRENQNLHKQAEWLMTRIENAEIERDRRQRIELANHMKSIPAIDNTEAKQPKKKWWRFGK